MTSEYFFNTIVEGLCPQVSECDLRLSIDYGSNFTECWYVCSNTEDLLKLIIGHLDKYGVKALFGNLNGKLFYLRDLINNVTHLKRDPRIKGLIATEVVKPQNINDIIRKLIRIVPKVKVIINNKVNTIKVLLNTGEEGINASILFLMGLRILKPFEAPPIPSFMRKLKHTCDVSRKKR